MQTRRQLLQAALLAPVVGFPTADASSPVDIISEADCLSRESALGFGRIAAPAKNVIIACGAGANARARAVQLRGRAARGAWIIWEHSPLSLDHDETLPRVFGIQTAAPLNPGLYITYVWPHAALTRSFLRAVPVICSPCETVAHHSATPLAMKRRIGCGGIVFLGSMLGPNLHAREPQALQIATALFSGLD